MRPVRKIGIIGFAVLGTIVIYLGLVDRSANLRVTHRKHIAGDKSYGPEMDSLVEARASLGAAQILDVQNSAPIVLDDAARVLPERFAKLGAVKHVRPTVELVDEFTSNDEPKLLELYANEHELTNRKAITWVLAAVGGDASGLQLVRVATNGGAIQCCRCRSGR